MDYEPFRIAGQPYVGSTVLMHSAPGESNLGNFIAWDAGAGKIVWSVPEQFSVWSGALATAGDVVFYGTLEGYLKAVDMKTGKECQRRSKTGPLGRSKSRPVWVWKFAMCRVRPGGDGQGFAAGADAAFRKC